MLMFLDLQGWQNTYYLKHLNKGKTKYICVFSLICTRKRSVQPEEAVQLHAALQFFFFFFSHDTAAAQLA